MDSINKNETNYLFTNNIINEYFEKEKENLNYSTDYNKQLFFISKYLLTDPSNEDINIDEDNFIKKDFVDVVWTKYNEAQNISFIKLCSRKEILNDELLIDKIKESKKLIEHEAQIIERIQDENELNDHVKTNNIFYFINTDEQDIENTNNIINTIKNDMFITEDDEIRIINNNELIQLINSFQKPKISIDSDEIEIYNNEKNILCFNNDNLDSIIQKSYICSISAKSLKKLYQSHGNNLLNLNLRYFKKSKKVDGDIKKSINNPIHFWHLNNGITIICDSIHINGNKIRLNDFSIINGGQTTFNISNTNFEKDFYLICKIICIENWISNEKNEKAFELANDIAISSNKQKPIKDKDLCANLASVNKIKTTCLNNIHKWDYPMLISTKTGESYDRKKLGISFNKEQVIPIEKLLQLHWSWFNLSPGLAKNAKSKMYSTDLEENLKFIDKNISIYPEILLLFNMIEKMKKKHVKKNKNKYIDGIVKNFNLFLVSMISVIFINWNYYKNNNIKIFEKFNSFNEIPKEYFNVKKIFNDNLSMKEIENKIYNLFTSLEDISSSGVAIAEVLEQSLHELGQDNSYIHNFVKNDSNFWIFAKKFITLFSTNTNVRFAIEEVFAIDK